MGFWSNLLGSSPNHEGVTSNGNVPSVPATVGAGDYSPGDPEGFVVEGEETFSRALPAPMVSPWDGWPAEWSTPTWHQGIQKLADTARDCIDLNASVLCAMPVYRASSGRIQSPLSWMSNPDPAIYTDWTEFAKQLFWDFQMGEVFVMPSDFYASSGKPSRFRIIPPWMVSVDMVPGGRRYKIGTVDVTDDILHIRYNSTTDQPRGTGPLEGAGARMVAAELLTTYAAELASTGGQTNEWISSDQKLTKPQADELLEQWLDSKKRNMGLGGVFGHGATLNQAKAMSAKDMALLELAQFTEARISVKLGVPPFLVGLPSGGDSMTYSNVSSLFDFHHRASLNPKVARVMKALSFWALPRGQRAELNRDEYTRPPLTERATAYKALAETGAAIGSPVITSEEIRTMERLQGEAPAEALTGGDEL